MAAIKITFLILACVCIWGCASRRSSPEQTSSTAKIQPCSLISKEEAGAALGGEVGVAERPDRNACSYDLISTGTPDEMRSGTIVVVVVTSDSPQFEKFGSTDASNALTPVSGLGDRAVLIMSRDRPDEGAKAIQVLKGKMYVAIGMTTPSTPVSVDTLKSLAAKAVSRLP